MNKRRPRYPSSGSSRDRYERDYVQEPEEYAPPESSGNKPKPNPKSLILNAFSMAVLAGVFILGIGLGIAFTSVGTSAAAGRINNNIDLDRQAPNPEVCVQFGASAIVMDARVFVTLNPLNVFISQPSTRPGCVLRNNNWSVLEQRNLVKPDQVRECKQRMNTFGFTGTLDAENAQIDCIYQNDAAKNLFLTQPGLSGGPAPENQRF